MVDVAATDAVAKYPNEIKPNNQTKGGHQGSYRQDGQETEGHRARCSGSGWHRSSSVMETYAQTACICLGSCISDDDVRYIVETIKASINNF